MIVVGGRKRQMQPRSAAALDNLRLALGAAYFARLIDRHDVRVSQVIGGRHPTRARDPCMPPADAVNSHPRPLRPGSGPDEDCLLKRAVLVSLALLVAGHAAAGEMESPAVTLSDVNWAAAAASSSDHGNEPAAEAFARLNAITGKRFTGIAKSTVPVLLPFDVDAFRKDVADGKSDAVTSEKYFGGFHPTKFFLAGPAGYDATYTLSDKADGLKIDFEKPIVFEISGAAFVYDLDAPNHIEKEEPPPKDLAAQFPGIRRILSEAHVRYVFERFGVPYVLSIQCYDMRPSSRHLSCREADPLALRFLNLLHTAGGAPAKIEQPAIRPSPAGGKIRFHLLQPGRSDREFRLEKNARPRRLSRLRPHALSDRRRAGLRQVAILHAVGRLLPQRHRRAARPQGRAVSLQGQRQAAGVRRIGGGKFHLSVARQFLRVARFPGRPVPGRLRPPG